MSKYVFVILGFVLMQFSSIIYAESCPDTKSSSLSWGAIPPPWQFWSGVDVQGEAGMTFTQAKISTTGADSGGVICTYHISTGDFLIKKLGNASPSNDQWVKNNYYHSWICKTGVSLCLFKILPL